MVVAAQLVEALRYKPEGRGFDSGASTSRNPKGLSRPEAGKLHLLQQKSHKIHSEIHYDSVHCKSSINSLKTFLQIW